MWLIFLLIRSLIIRTLNPLAKNTCIIQFSYHWAAMTNFIGSFSLYIVEIITAKFQIRIVLCVSNHVNFSCVTTTVLNVAGWSYFHIKKIMLHYYNPSRIDQINLSLGSVRIEIIFGMYFVNLIISYKFDVWQFETYSMIKFYMLQIM